jgi:hypothetical protein
VTVIVVEAAVEVVTIIVVEVAVEVVISVELEPIVEVNRVAVVFADIHNEIKYFINTNI